LKAPCARTLLLSGVLAALCFSVGEGLRLLPLPHILSSTSVSGEPGPDGLRPGSARQNQFKSGSMSLPPQAQKNLQYRQTHCAPPSGCALPPPRQALRRSGAQWRQGRDLTASVPGPSGRAPPPAA
jgi:hypothetical protein